MGWNTTDDASGRDGGVPPQLRGRRVVAIQIGEAMNPIVGLWIDRRKAVVVEIEDGAERVVTVRSNVAGRSGRFGSGATASRDDAPRPAPVGYYARVLARIADA
jgi:hypothetical protein